MILFPVSKHQLLVWQASVSAIFVARRQLSAFATIFQCMTSLTDPCFGTALGALTRAANPSIRPTQAKSLGTTANAVARGKFLNGVNYGWKRAEVKLPLGFSASTSAFGLHYRFFTVFGGLTGASRASVDTTSRTKARPGEASVKQRILHRAGTLQLDTLAYTQEKKAVPTETICVGSSSPGENRRNKMNAMAGFDPKDPQQVADVVLVPVLADNYAYLLIDRGTKQAACVDPAEPDKVLAAAQKEHVTLSLCLCTHKHLDHSGGNEELARILPKIQIAGSAYESVPGVNKELHDGETINLGDLRIEARHVPCHTAGHLFYFVTNSKNPTQIPILFSGDTLFVGGCGRFFEGSARQMHHALINICNSFPKETRVYCGHEYTKANLEFALSVEPNNEALKAKYKWATQQRKEGKPTIPSSLEQEKQFNPFMRVEENSVQSAMQALGDPVETMHLLRQRKNAK